MYLRGFVVQAADFSNREHPVAVLHTLADEAPLAVFLLQSFGMFLLGEDGLYIE